MAADLLRTDTRIDVVGGKPLPGQVRLPTLDGVESYDDSPAETLGWLVSEHARLLGAGTLIGGVLGASTGSSLIGKVVRGIGGAAAGAATGGLLGAIVGHVFGSDSASTHANVRRGGSSSTPTQDPGQTPAPEHLRVMDWNVQGFVENGSMRRGNDAVLNRMAAAIREQHPDVLLLQEVQTDGPLAWQGVDDVARIARAVGATDAVLVPNGSNLQGSHRGQAILTFGDTRIQDARGLHHLDPHRSQLADDVRSLQAQLHGAGLPVSAPSGVIFHPRTTADAMITTPDGQAVRVLNVHLSGTSQGGAGGSPGSTQRMREQLVPLADTLDAWSGPTLLAGDFNVRAGTSYGDFEAQTLGQQGMRDAMTAVGIAPDSDERNSYTAWNPYKNIDRIYTSEQVSVRDAHVVQELAGSRAYSDHLPVVADVEIG